MSYRTLIRGVWVSLALALVIPSLTAPLQAQVRRQGAPPPREELEARVRERFEAIVDRELGLTPVQAEALRQAVQSFQGERQELARRQMILRRQLGSADSLTREPEARVLLAELVEVQRQEARIMEMEIDRLLTVLTPAQVVRFYTLRERMAERMRALQERMGPPGRRGPGGGGGAPYGAR